MTRPARGHASPAAYATRRHLIAGRQWTPHRAALDYSAPSRIGRDRTTACLSGGARRRRAGRGGEGRRDADVSFCSEPLHFLTAKSPWAGRGGRWARSYRPADTTHAGYSHEDSTEALQYHEIALLLLPAKTTLSKILFQNTSEEICTVGTEGDPDHGQEDLKDLQSATRFITSSLSLSARATTAPPASDLECLRL